MSLRNCTGAIALQHRRHVFWKVKNYVYTINGRNPQGDFEDPTDDMIRDYIKSKWLITTPEISTNPPHDFKDKLRFADFEYDGFATYHAMIKQDGDATFDNEYLGVGMLGVFEPIMIEMTARRLTYGKTFQELDFARNEIVRILAQFEPDSHIISGIQAIEVLDPGDIERASISINKLPQSIWRAQVKLMLTYYKNWYIEGEE